MIVNLDTLQKLEKKKFVLKVSKTWFYKNQAIFKHIFLSIRLNQEKIITHFSFDFSFALTC